ncbi:MAG: hypothetical protein ACKESB_03275 [Candidatus Hodgkinia cicadicola]
MSWEVWGVEVLLTLLSLLASSLSCLITIATVVCSDSYIPAVCVLVGIRRLVYGMHLCTVYEAAVNAFITNHWYH